MHVVSRSAVIPVVFALLPNKTQQTYRRLIEKIIELCPLFNPKSVMLDIERAAINAFNEKFDNLGSSFSVSGCFFHVQNSIQRKVQVSD